MRMLLATLSLISIASIAEAQFISNVPKQQRVIRGSVQPAATAETTTIVLPAAPARFGNEPRAATAMESFERGRGALIRSYGEAYRDTAEAQIYLRTSERMGIDNWQHGINTKWSVSDRYQARRNEAYTPLSLEQYKKIARDAAPPQLSSSQLSSDGQIDWPVALRDDRFASLRGELEALFVERASGVSSSRAAENIRDTRAAANEWLVQLRAQLDEYSTSDYVIAKSFLLSLRCAPISLQGTAPLEGLGGIAGGRGR